MDSLLALLPLLACPLMMGLMMWMMMRGQPSQTSAAASAVEAPTDLPIATAQTSESQHAEPARPNAGPLSNALRLCLNWKVVAALALVGLGFWVVAPGLIWWVLPVLLLAACPLSMLLMMPGMQASQREAQPPETSQSISTPLKREHQLSHLRGRLASTQAEEDALAREITVLAREQSATSARQK